VGHALGSALEKIKLAQPATANTLTVQPLELSRHHTLEKMSGSANEKTEQGQHRKGGGSVVAWPKNFNRLDSIRSKHLSQVQAFKTRT
jgi:hypothetical protein